MDPLDPLNTSEPTAPHTSSISGNRYLVRKPEEKTVTGNVLKVLQTQQLEEDFQGGWWALVGFDMYDSPLLFEGQKSCLVHLKGHRLLAKDEKLLLAPSQDSVVFARLIALSSESLAQLPATEIGELTGVKIYSEVISTEDAPCSTDTSRLLACLQKVFPYADLILAYYIYTQIGEFPAVSSPPPVEYGADIVESVTRFDLLQYRTGVPSQSYPVTEAAATDPVPVAKAEGELQQTVEVTAEQTEQKPEAVAIDSE